MKKILTYVFLVCLLCTVAYGLTYTIESKPNATWWSGSYRDIAWRWAKEVEDILEEDAVLFNPTDTVPTATEGRLYYDDSSDDLILYTSTGWKTLDKAGASSLDTAYNNGITITVDAGAIVLTAPNANDNVVLTLDQQDTAGTVAALGVGSAGDAAAIIIAQTGSGGDIEGTAGWSVTKGGVGTYAGLIVGGTDIVMENSDTFNNVDNDVFEFDSGTEDFEIDLTGTNIVKFTSDTTAVTLEFDTLDDVNGVGNIYFDAAASTIKLTSNAAADDLTIEVAGSTDSSLILKSAGTGADSVSIQATKGIDIDAVDDLNIRNTASTDADDFHIRLEGEHNSSLILSSDGTGGDALALLTDDSANSGDIDITSGDDLDINVTDNMTVDTTDGSLAITVAGSVNGDMTVAVADAFTLTSTDTAQNGVHIEANGGTAESINLYSNQGTGTSATTEHDASIQLQSDAGGISLYTTGNVVNAISLETNGGTTETINIRALQGSIVIEAEEDAANAVLLIADGGTSSTLELFNDTGTSVTDGAASIQLISDLGGINLKTSIANAAGIVLNSTAGGIDITSAASYDIDITPTGGKCLITPSEAATDQFKVDAIGAATGAAINLETTSGGIILTADHSTNGDITLDAEDDIILTTTGKLTITNTEAVTVSGDLDVDGVITTDGINTSVVAVGDVTAYDVLAANTGMVHIIPDLTGDLTMDLPTEAAGLYYKFIYVGGAEDAQDWTIDSENNTNFFTGGLATVDDDDGDCVIIYSDNTDDSICKIDTPNAGTIVEIWSNGTVWYMTGTVYSGTDTAVVFSNL